MPRRLQISSPTAIAMSVPRPEEPCVSAAASTAGTTVALGCRTEGRWVSSKSSEWAKVPLRSAALGAGSRPATPIADDSGVPPQRVTRRRMDSHGSGPLPSLVPYAAYAFPSASSNRRWASSTTSSGIPSSRDFTAKAASCWTRVASLTGGPLASLIRPLRGAPRRGGEPVSPLPRQASTATART